MAALWFKIMRADEQASKDLARPGARWVLRVGRLAECPQLLAQIERQIGTLIGRVIFQKSAPVADGRASKQWQAHGEPEFLRGGRNRQLVLRTFDSRTSSARDWRGQIIASAPLLAAHFEPSLRDQLRQVTLQSAHIALPAQSLL